MEKKELDILAHLQDGHTIEIFAWEIPLPVLRLWEYELPITRHTVMLWLSAAVITLVSIPAARQKSRVPSGMRNLLEAFLVFVRDQIAVPQIGEKARYFVPFLSTLFLFILCCNLLGLFPFCSTATGNLAVTGTLALISAFATHFSGIFHKGFVGYLKTMAPSVPAALYPLMFVLELISHIARPFSLTVRLFVNMLSGHIVLLVVMGFIFIFRNLAVAGVSVAVAVALSCLEILICFLQAYVFTYLSALFLGMAVQSEH